MADPSDTVLELLAEELRQTRKSAEKLIESTDNLASQEYVDKLHADTEKKQRRFVITTVVAVLFAVFFAATNTFLLFQLKSVADNNRQSSQILIECSTPSMPGDVHQCFDRATEFSERVLENQRELLKNQEEILNRIERLLIRIDVKLDKQNGQSP